MGLAYYRRSFKLSDPKNCHNMFCPFAGRGGDKGPYTNFEGVLSNKEIETILHSGEYSVTLNDTAAVKYMTYGARQDSWIAFDDRHIFTLKEQFANKRCLGGMMIWSVDFHPSMGGQFSYSDLVWIDPKIWKDQHPQISCRFPCTLVLPPWPVTSVTIDYPPITISSEAFTTTVNPELVTISSVHFSTVVISHGANAQNIAITPTPITTLNAWPMVAYHDGRGIRRSTRHSGPGPLIFIPSPTPTLQVPLRRM
jgi:hypothetical protein